MEGWGPANVWGLFPGSGQHVIIGRSLELWGNFPNNFIIIIKNIKNYCEDFRKLQILNGKFLIFARWGKIGIILYKVAIDFLLY